jgi:phosphopantothenoylcysteine synthetase/decarboxylase
LQADGFEVIQPDEGWQACRTVGVGRLPEPAELLAVVRKRLKQT